MPVALFWATGRCGTGRSDECDNACKDAMTLSDCPCRRPHVSCDGRLHVFAVPRGLVRPYDSDRISIVANFANLALLQQELLLTKTDAEIDFDYVWADEVATDSPRHGFDESMTTLLPYIRREKPYVSDSIDIRDFFRVYVVEPQRSFERLRAQSGAFMLSAFHERYEGIEVAMRSAGNAQFDHYILEVPADEKTTIREELDWLNIKASNLKADIETSTEAIGRQYRDRAKQLQEIVAMPQDDSATWTETLPD